MSLHSHKSRVVLVLATFILHCVQPAVSEPLAIQDFVADSINRSPQVLEQVHVYRQTRQDKTIASSGWRPSVDVTATAGRYEGDSPVLNGQVNDFSSERAEISLTQNLFTGFDTTNRIKEAEARASSALFELYDSADNVALEAVQAYLDVLRNARLLELARINVESHEETLEKISRRSRSGAGRRSQLEQTEGRTARARASYIAQQNNFQDALTQAHQVLGRYLDLSSLIEPELPVLPGQQLDDLIDFALENHPALKVATLNIQAASANYKQAKSRRLPKLDVRLAQEYGNDLNGIPGRTDQASVTLNLNYNLYNGGADRAERRKRISFVGEQQQFAARVRRQVINTLRLAWMADQSLVEQLKYLQRYVEQAEKTSESYQEEFFIGQRDLIDLLDAKSELNSAKNSFAEAHYDALAARFRILEGTGQIFNAIGLNPEMSDDGLVIAKVDTQGLDTLPLNKDFDEDAELDVSDHCDNSILDSSVNVYGCVQVASADEQVASVGGANSAPSAEDDEFFIKDGRVLIITQAFLLQNDSDVDRDVLEIEGFTQPKNGLLAYDDQRNLVYRPDEGFLGRDSFSYTLSDGRDVDSGAVFVEVQPEYTLDISAVHMVNYRFDRAELTRASINKFNQVAAVLTDNPGLRIRISAYTDSTGSEEYNQNLSWRRAKETMAALMAKGVSKEQIETFGGGEANPIADNATKEGQAINRRGEFEFISN